MRSNENKLNCCFSPREHPKPKLRDWLSTEAHAIFEAPSRAAAETRLWQLRTTWGTLEPEVVRRLTKDVDACLTFSQRDRQLHPLIRSTECKRLGGIHGCIVCCG